MVILYLFFSNLRAAWVPSLSGWPLATLNKASSLVSRGLFILPAFTRFSYSAMAKYEQDLALIKASRLKDLIPLAPSVQKEILKSACAEENKIVNWLDRINRTCVHQSDNLRTQLSFEKEQIRQMGYNT